MPFHFLTSLDWWDSCSGREYFCSPCPFLVSCGDRYVCPCTLVCLYGFLLIPYVSLAIKFSFGAQNPVLVQWKCTDRVSYVN